MKQIKMTIKITLYDSCFKYMPDRCDYRCLYFGYTLVLHTFTHVLAPIRTWLLVLAPVLLASPPHAAMSPGKCYPLLHLLL